MSRSRVLSLLALLLAALLIVPAAASADSLALDGDNDYVEAGLDPTATESTTARTWEAWVKTTSNTDHRGILGRYRHVGGKEPWILHLVDGVPTMTLGGATVRYAAEPVTDGQWHHVAAVWEPGIRLDIYIDGERSNGDLRGFVPSALTVADDVSIRLGVTNLAGQLYGHISGGLDGVSYSRTARYESDFDPPACPVIDEDTVAAWNFEEGSGTTTATAGMIVGEAELVNGAGFGDGTTCAGAPREALRFDGVDDRVTASDTTGATGSSRTWEAWVKTTSNEYQAIVGSHPEETEGPWILDMEDGVPRVHVQNGAAHGARYASVTVNDGKWHHVAAVWEAGDRLDLYVDGKRSNGALGGGTVPSSLAGATGAELRIGVGDHDGELDGYFRGSIDSVRVSSTDRYDEDFVPEPCPEADEDTLVLWAFSEGEGTTTTSSGSSNVTAQLHDGVEWVAGPVCTPVATGDYAVLLDGVNDSVGAGPDPTAAETTTARTWEAWVKTSSSAQMTVMSRYRNAGGDMAWLMDLNNGVPRMHMYWNRYADKAINDGQWHHLAAVWEPGTRLDLYIDGELSNGPMDGPVPAELHPAPGVPMRFGVVDINTFRWYFAGALDGIRYSTGARYTGAFSPGIRPAADAATIGVWNFDEGTGTTTSSGGQQTVAATLLDGATWTLRPEN